MASAETASGLAQPVRPRPSLAPPPCKPGTPGRPIFPRSSLRRRWCRLLRHLRFCRDLRGGLNAWWERRELDRHQLLLGVHLDNLGMGRGGGRRDGGRGEPKGAYLGEEENAEVKILQKKTNERAAGRRRSNFVARSGHAQENYSRIHVRPGETPAHPAQAQGKPKNTPLCPLSQRGANGPRG